MAQKHRNNNANKRNRHAPSPRGPQREAPPPYQLKPIVQYDKPITILEDTMRNTFEFKGGAWVPFNMTIAECRKGCLVKELPQKVNQMVRYEVRCPIPT